MFLDKHKSQKASNDRMPIVIKFVLYRKVYWHFIFKQIVVCLRCLRGFTLKTILHKYTSIDTRVTKSFHHRQIISVLISESKVEVIKIELIKHI